MKFPEITGNFTFYGIPDSKAGDIYLILISFERQKIHVLSKFPEPGQVTFISRFI